ncbi:MAG TPA: DM13 domain-containing protein [Arthrobacter sp.]|nr:DM13 domain-containing protein [Arthrobacter sp.]
MSAKSGSAKPSAGAKRPFGRRNWTIAVVVAAVGLVIGLVVFKPWLLFVDVRVDEQLPIAASAPAQVQPTPPTQPAPLASEQDTGPATPTPAPTPAGPVQLAVGTLISHEHTTTGTVRIVRQPDGTRVLTLENLDTSNGPDVHVWLSAAHVVEGTAGWFTAGSAEYYDLGMIKGNQGNQVYQIPADVDLAKYPAVDLWCVQFSVSFGAAELVT